MPCMAAAADAEMASLQSEMDGHRLERMTDSTGNLANARYCNACSISMTAAPHETSVRLSPSFAATSWP
jgi:hypothetical protein